MNSPEVERDLAGVRGAHRRLLATISDLSEEQARQPSRLPDWSVGHVLTHLARNADGLSRMMEAAVHGEIADMYVGGVEGRAADIAAGAERPAEELVADVRHGIARLERAWADATDDAWSGQGRMVTGPVALVELPWRRWREAEVHHADLGLSYDFADWPADFVRFELVRMTGQWASRKPMGLTSLPAAALEAAPNDRLAWLFGRRDIAGVPAAGVF